MWYKVKELREKQFNNSQISRELGIDRNTVRKYLQLGEAEFLRLIEQGRKLPLKLDVYLSFVKRELERQPYLSAAQIEDRLKENYSNLPDVHSKTVYNFVQRIRHQYDINKANVKSEGRIFEQQPAVDYGQQAQVDFGESYLLNPYGVRMKVYFFVMVLSRSRYKFVYFQKEPFTSSSAIYAHELSFEYFQGIPREILYDQDSVFIYRENLGDYILTHEFKAYSQRQPFKVVFCRNADPQTKGKVENVVGYIKKNFLRGRSFTSIEALNEAALEWLQRTGNAKRHAATQLFPAKEWEHEKHHLTPYQTKISQQKRVLKPYHVRKDNTINYKSNFYTLPVGTYKDRKTIVLVEESETMLHLYTNSDIWLASHQVSLSKGELIRNINHSRDKSKSMTRHFEQVIGLLPNNPLWELYLEKLKQDKPRYFNDNLRVINKGLTGLDKQVISQSVTFCLENKLYNGYGLCEAARGFAMQLHHENTLGRAQLQPVEHPENLKRFNQSVHTSDINTYEKLF